MQLISMQLTDFQAHKRLDVVFEDRITTIIGATDKGKTAILRALGWVAQNNLSGEEFIREGAKATSVKLVLTDGKKTHTILRTKASRVNTYALDGKEYVAFGQAVPADIARLLQLSDINFQGQHDAPFWFSETAGEVSRKLNSVIDLSIIDSTLSGIASTVRQAQEWRSLTQERLRKAKDQLEVLLPQLRRIKEFETLTELKDDEIKTRNDADQLEIVLAEVDTNNARELKHKWAECADVFTAAKDSVRASRQCGSLQELLQDLSKAGAAAVYPPDFTVVEEAYKTWRKLEDRANGLSSLEDRIGDWESTLRARTGAYNALEAKSHKQLKGQQCPLCGNQIS